MKETNSHVSAIEQLLFTNVQYVCLSHFFLDKKVDKKSRLSMFSLSFFVYS